MSVENYWTDRNRQNVRRRRLLTGAVTGAAGLSAMALVGCGDDDDAPAASGTPDGRITPASAPGVQLIPPGLEQRYPEIAEYHWSKMTVSKNAPKRGGTFRTHGGGGQDPSTWDPAQPGINTYVAMFQPFYNRILKPDMSLESAFAGKDNFFKLLVEGDLAEKVPEQPDPLTYVFALRKGVKFQDIPPMNGAEMTADDVVFSLQSYRDPKALGQTSIFRDVDKIELIDKYSFKITMKKPTSYFLYSMTGPNVVIFSRDAYQKVGLQDAPMGTGAYMLEKHDYRNITTAKRNPNYFVPELPYLDGIEIRTIADQAALISAYRTGQLDVFEGTSTWENFEAIMSTEKGKTDVRVFQHNSGGQANFAVNHRRTPWNDVRVRRGLSMALDRDAMVAARFKIGRWAIGLPTDWSARHWPPKGEEFGPYFQFNQKEAKSLLSAASFNPEFTLIVNSATGQADDQVVLATEYWKMIGLKPTIKIMDSVAYNKQFLAERDFDMAYGGIVATGTDIDDFGYRLMHTGEPANVYGINDPTVDSITEDIQKTFERAPREKLGEDLLQRELDQVNRIWSVSQLVQDFKRPYVQGGYISHDVYFWANSWA